MTRALALLGRMACIFPHTGGLINLTEVSDIVPALAHIIRRHPLPEAEARRALERALPGNVNAALAVLAADGFQLVECYGQRFWRAAEPVAGN